MTGPLNGRRKSGPLARRYEWFGRVRLAGAYPCRAPPDLRPLVA
jgi:hypothetical protein